MQAADKRNTHNFMKQQKQYANMKMQKREGRQYYQWYYELFQKLCVYGIPCHWSSINICIPSLNKACIHLQPVTLIAFKDVALFRCPRHGQFSGHLRRCAYFGCHLGCCIIVLFTKHGLIISTALFIGEETDSCRHWSDQSVPWTQPRLFDVY